MHTYHRLLRLPHHKLDNFSFLAVASTLRTFVLTYLVIFLPPLLLKQFKTIYYSEKQAMLIVGIIYIFLPISAIFFNYLTSWFNHKKNLRFSFLIGQLFFAVFLFINTLKIYNQYLTIINFIIWGLAASLWWISYHCFFLEIGEKKKFGSEISSVEIFGTISGLVAPLIGGFILQNFDQTFFYLFAGIVIIFSIIFISLIKEKEQMDQVLPRDIFKEIIKYKRDFIAYVGAGGDEMIYSLVWPLFLITILKNYLQMGLFSSVVIFIAVIVMYFVGKLSDLMSKDTLEKVGSSFLSINWLIKALAQNIFFVFILDALYKICYGIFFIPFRAIAYDNALQTNKAKYIVFRDTGYEVGNILAILIFIATVYFGLPIWFNFISAAIFSLLTIAIRDRYVV